MLGKIGSSMLLFGVGSIVLYFIGYNLRLLMWIDNWGETVGWGIRGGLVVVGGLLWLFGSSKGEVETETEKESVEN